MVHLKLQMPVRGRLYLKRTPSKSLESNRTPHESSSAKSRDILRTTAASSTKSEATRTPLSGRSKQTPRTISTYRTKVESTRTYISSSCLCQAQRTRDPQYFLDHGVHPSTSERRNWKVCSGFQPACTMAPQEKDLRLIIGLS